MPTIKFEDLDTPGAEAMADEIEMLEIQRFLDKSGLAPIPMILHCPKCHTQHIDKVTPCSYSECEQAGMCYCSRMGEPERCDRWDNPPHRSHLCHVCRTVWRPCDLTTTGVQSIITSGKADTWTP